MKLAAISPRMISFNHVKPATGGTRTTLRLNTCRPAIEYREARPPHLTPRELEVLALLCEGLSNKLIGRQLNISAGTVKIHVGKILAELGVSSRLQAVVAAHRRGLVPDADPESNEQAPADHATFAPRSRPMRALQAA